MEDQQAAATTSSAPAYPTVGQAVSSGGVTLTVTAAGPVPTVAMNDSSYAPTSSYARWTQTPPPTGAEFCSMTVHVRNNAQVSMDLTCGYPIANKLVNAQNQQYDAIEDLYKIKRNPECNKNLQPGFEADMTYVYAVPTGSAIVAWAFADATDLGNQQPYSIVQVGP